MSSSAQLADRRSGLSTGTGPAAAERTRRASSPALLRDPGQGAWRCARPARAWHCEVMQTVYEAAGGNAGLCRLAEAWHARVMADEIVSHAFSHGFHPQHTERLAAYWAEALGGPPAYTGGMGDETEVVRMHSGNGPHEEMDERAQDCFAAALDDADLPADPRLRATLRAYFT